MEADIDNIREYMNSLEPGENAGSDQVNRLRKYRACLLEDIHNRQQCLDSIDYLIKKIKNNNNINNKR